MTILDQANLPPEARAVIDRWNARMPKGRVRLMNPARWRELLGAISLYGAEAICQAIDHYARRPWNRAKGAWTTFDRFIDARRVCQEIEAAAEDEELARHAAAKSARPAPAVGRMTALIGAAPPTAEQLAAEVWDQMDEPGRKALLEEAYRELVKLNGRPNIPPARVQSHARKVVLVRRIQNHGRAADDAPSTGG